MITSSPSLNELVNRHEDYVFLVDFDGTMVELVPDPEDVRVPPELIRDIEAIISQDKIAFAIVTGRSIERLDRFLQQVQAPIIGGHGAEYRLSSATGIELLAAPFSVDMLDALKIVSARHDCIFENKIFSLSIHLPFEHIAKDLMSEILTALGSKAPDYLIRKAGRTYEITWHHVNKGTGIAHLMKQLGFKGRRPVYIGDDAYTDESLRCVLDMGGKLLHVRSSNYNMDGTEETLLEVSHVRQILFNLTKIN